MQAQRDSQESPWMTEAPEHYKDHAIFEECLEFGTEGDTNWVGIKMSNSFRKL